MCYRDPMVGILDNIGGKNYFLGGDARENTLGMYIKYNVTIEHKLYMTENKVLHCQYV